MRVSSGMIFDAGVAAINRQTSSLLATQQQVSSGKRILRPSDDPVAAARALETQQGADVVAQFKANHDYASATLGLQEAQLTSAGDLVARIRELAVQAGSTNLTSTARQGLAVEIRASFDRLLALANSTDGSGNYLFSGFMSSTMPFGGNVDSIIAGGEIVYQGDDGQRSLQVSPSRFIEVSESGRDLFQRVASGNGYFATDYAAGNTGTGIVSSGTVADPAAWQAASARDIDIRFTVSGGVTTYDLVDTASGNSLLTGAAAPAPLLSQRTYQPGQPILLKSQGLEPAFDLGGSVSITGSPASGDSFSVAPSSSQSVFATISNLVGALEGTLTTPADNAQYINEVAFALNDLARAGDNLLGARARIGARMNEIESLASLNDDLGLQYQQALSKLQDVDYTQAITDLTRKQVQLEAAQQSFLRVAQLSLFNIL